MRLNRFLGASTAPRRHSGPHPGAEELSQTLIRLAGKAPERIKLQQARVELAMALKRHVRPAELPEVPRLGTAACYVPARAGLDVGGDWHDAITMSGETAGIAIGDVQGHDVQAAAFAGRIHTGLRVLAGVTTDPGDVLARINDRLASHDGNPGPASSAGGDGVAPFVRGGG